MCKDKFNSNQILSVLNQALSICDMLCDMHICDMKGFREASYHCVKLLLFPEKVTCDINSG